jgi:hypothetical protein
VEAVILLSAEGYSGNREALRSEMKQSATIKEIVEFGLDSIPSEQAVTVNLRDFMYIFRVLEEYMRFFHNPDHYPTIERVKRFLGTVSSGDGFEALDTALYKKAYKMAPKELEDMLDNDAFEHPLFPDYYQARSSEEGRGPESLKTR